ncbi:MAG: hypothetical protein H6702_11120 [Myxococcales bacterium]|nr:hypothetical protein [Myxococcales bacterium]
MHHARLVFAFALLALLAACSRKPPDPQARVRAFLTQLEESVERQDMSAIKPLISGAYHDDRGHDKKAVLRYLQLRFLKRQAIHAYVKVVDLHLRADGGADVDLRVAVAATALPDVDAVERLRAAVYSMQLTLAADDDGFQLTQARWRQAGLTDLVD